MEHVGIPVGLADYGLAIFVVGGLLWFLSLLIKNKNHENDLTKIITENTSAITRLTDAIEDQKEILRKQDELLSRLLIELAREERIKSV